MEWTLNEDEMKEYGKEMVKSVMEEGIPCDIRKDRDGRTSLTIPDEEFRRLIGEDYDNSPALQVYYDRDAFVDEAVESFRKGLKAGLIHHDEVIRTAEEKYPDWIITGISYAPEEDGLQVEVYRNGDCIHLSQQLHQCKDGTDRLPEPYDNDCADCWSHIEKDGRDALNPDEEECCRFLGAAPGHGEETFKRLIGRAMDVVADADRCIPRKEEVFYQEPRKDYVIVSLAPDETPDKKPHEIHFTKEDFEELDKEKTFPKGFTAHPLTVNEYGIIRTDAAHPERGGKRLTDACPDFHDASYSLKAVQKAMKKAAKATGR